MEEVWPRELYQMGVSCWIDVAAGPSVEVVGFFYPGIV